MTGLLTLPWPWYALALVIAAGLIWLVRWYDDRPATLSDHYLTAVNDNISCGRCQLVTAPGIDSVAAAERAADEREFVMEIEAWLAARARYEEQT